MKILLTHGYFLHEDPVEKGIMKPYPPLGLLYLSGYLREKTIKHKVFDTTFSTRDELKEVIRSWRPDAIGFYVNFLTRKNVLEIISWIRNDESLVKPAIILGGPDVRHHTGAYLERGADYLVLGEGEETFHELVSALDAQAPLDGIPGLAYLSGENVVFTAERGHMQDMGNLPLPNREAINIPEYLAVWKKHHGQSSISVNTQRGCSFTCKWCSHAVFGDTYRRRPANKVVDELEMLVNEYKPDSFWFVDDVFTMSQKWLIEFSKQLETRGLKIRYECITRADRLNREVLALLKQTGCNMLWIGAESGSQRVLDLMDRKVDVRQVRRMIQLAKKQDIQTGTFIMLGYPGETKRDIRETIDHLLECMPDRFTINLAYPIKGTALYEEVSTTIIRGFDWSITPDREIRFEMPYNPLYYKMALRKIYNRVHAEKEKKSGNWPAFLRLRVKASLAGIIMRLT